MKTYTGILKELPENAVAVIGSNPVNYNGNPEKGTGGAALWALNNGYIRQRECLDNRLSKSGRVWGLTTVSKPGAKRSKTPEEIKWGIVLLYQYAEDHPEIDFYVLYSAGARNLNGYSDLEMAKMFKRVSEIPENIIFEEKFGELINNL